MRKRLMVEELEGRRLLSGSPVQCLFENTRLTVNGSSGADEISADMQGDATGTATVKVIVGHGRLAATKTFEGVATVNVYGNDGKDHIKLSGMNLSDSWPVWVYINGGRGNDVVRFVNFDGGVSVDGGDGNDLIDASRAFGPFSFVGPFSFRSLMGGSGDDRIIGSSSNDDLHGGAGNDIITGGAGDDWINGGSGTNVLKGGAGNDTFSVTSLDGYYPGSELGGFDKIFGGAGSDTIYEIYSSLMGPAEFGLVSTKSVEKIVLIDANGGAG